jgi:hypothetical protein
MSKSVSDGAEFVTSLMKIGQLESKILTAVIEGGDAPAGKEVGYRNRGT